VKNFRSFRAGSYSPCSSPDRLRYIPSAASCHEIVAVRVGLPKGKAQDLLDDLVLRGRLRMKSGQHGRCYSAGE